VGAARRLVLARDLFDLADPVTQDALSRRVAELAVRAGLEVDEQVLVGAEELVAIRDGFRAIQLVEAWQSNGEWITRRAPTFAPDVAGRFMAARDADPDAALAAAALRIEVREALDRLCGPDGVLLQPAASGPAHAHDVDDAAKEDLRGRTLTLTAVAGMAGAPVVAAPLARVEGLPVGLALVGRPGEDDLVVELARRLDSATGH